MPPARPPARPCTLQPPRYWPESLLFDLGNWTYNDSYWRAWSAAAGSGGGGGKAGSSTSGSKGGDAAAAAAAAAGASSSGGAPPKRLSLVYQVGYGCLPLAEVERSLTRVLSPGDAIVANVGPHCLRAHSLAQWRAYVDGLAALLARLPAAAAWRTSYPLREHVWRRRVADDRWHADLQFQARRGGGGAPGPSMPAASAPVNAWRPAPCLPRPPAALPPHPTPPHPTHPPTPSHPTTPPTPTLTIACPCLLSWRSRWAWMRAG